MFAPALRVAEGKATSEAMRVALASLVEISAQFDAAEEEFPAAIAQHNARRGEKSPKLNARTKQMLDGLRRDQDEIHAEMMASFERESAESIVWSLSFALKGALQNAEGMLKYYPEADRPLGVQQLERMRGLLSALEAFLIEHPADDAV